jgi:carbohydrate-binding DOMON domain-containing protein
VVHLLDTPARVRAIILPRRTGVRVWDTLITGRVLGALSSLCPRTATTTDITVTTTGRAVAARTVITTAAAAATDTDTITITIEDMVMVITTIEATVMVINTITITADTLGLSPLESASWNSSGSDDGAEHLLIGGAVAADT